MINYGYFRHKFDASNDPKLQSLVDEMGIIALGYYYSLLEIYGHHYSNKKENTAVQIHRRVIANSWRKRVDSCDKVLTKLQLSGLLVYTKCENTYTIDIPNFLKYYGSYKKKEPEKALSKEKKSKEKKSIKEKLKKVDILPELSQHQELFSNVSGATQKKILNEYQLEYIMWCVEESIVWLEDNPRRKFNGSFFTGWLKRGYDDWMKRNNRLTMKAESVLIKPDCSDEDFAWPSLLD